MHEKAKEYIYIKSIMQHQETNKVMTKMLNGELFVMNYLYEHNGIAYPKEISDYMKVSTARIAMILKSLEKQNSITREHDEKDSRYVVVKLTQNGNEDIISKRKDLLDCMVKLFEYIGEENANEYIRLSKMITEALEKIEMEFSE
jgi:DNA-binding MarR family transcriptional regulator